MPPPRLTDGVGHGLGPASERERTQGRTKETEGIRARIVTELKAGQSTRHLQKRRTFDDDTSLRDISLLEDDPSCTSGRGWKKGGGPGMEEEGRVRAYVRDGRVDSQCPVPRLQNKKQQRFFSKRTPTSRRSACARSRRGAA